jgi:cell division protein FtsB
MSQVNLGIWDKLTKIVVFLIGIAVVVGVCIWYLPLIQQNQRIRQQILRLNQEIQREEAAGRRLNTSINALQKESQTVERLARQNLGYAKTGEVVIRFDGPPAFSTNTP